MLNIHFLTNHFDGQSTKYSVAIICLLLSMAPQFAQAIIQVALETMTIYRVSVIGAQLDTRLVKLEQSCAV